MAFAEAKLPNESSYTLTLRMETQVAVQGYQRTVQGCDILLAASENSGFMYGLLDLAQAFALGEPIKDASATPYLQKRGIKFNIPLDARTPSYSDASTSAVKNIAVMWEKEFWHTFLDRMAEEKYNVLSLWSLSPFPSLVRIPEFPKACLDDVKVSTRPFHADLCARNMYEEDHAKSLVTVKKMTIDEKMAFWQDIMVYAKERCIQLYLFTWNVFVYGTEDSGYGLSSSLDNQRTRDYFYYGVKALMDTYPLLAGIGVTAGENMRFDEGTNVSSIMDVTYIYETYGRAIGDYLTEHPGRDFTMIHRMQMAKYDRIMEYYKDFPGKFEISFKYSQAHMYASTKPAFIKDFLAEKDPSVKIWLTVRNDDYYMARWGDPDFAREYLTHMPVDCMSGFYMGADGFTWGRDFMTRDTNEHPLFIDKMWYMFDLWGQLAYTPGLDKAHFVRCLAKRFGLALGQALPLYEAWQRASQILPVFHCTHWHDFDFQWYPEGCCLYLNDPVLQKLVFADINEFITCLAMPGVGYASAGEYARSVVSGEVLQGISPMTTIAQIQGYVQYVFGALPALQEASDEKEYQDTLADIKGMALLGEYYAHKELAAVKLAIYRLQGEQAVQDEAVKLLKEAAHMWKAYSSWMKQRYLPQVLTRLCGKVDLQDFDELADMDILLAMENS